ncbi:MAG: transposase [Candidatus Thiodiazotropha sp.]|nr:transposase [Candidatus Thiodiazotropha sp.]MCM8885699.1 transposase [Candidatus Thiodiazotropha sp.]MCM8922308.1 transposase [Candidatus Thiodiazotropha sp.]
MKTHCPNATLVLDRFHIVKALNAAAAGVKEVVASKWFMLPALPSPRWFVLTMG